MNKEKYVLKINHDKYEDCVTTKREVKGDKGRVVLTVLLDIIGECFKNGATKKDIYAVVDDIYDFVMKKEEE